MLRCLLSSIFMFEKSHTHFVFPACSCGCSYCCVKCCCICNRLRVHFSQLLLYPSTLFAACCSLLLVAGAAVAVERCVLVDVVADSAHDADVDADVGAGTSRAARATAVMFYTSNSAIILLGFLFYILVAEAAVSLSLQWPNGRSSQVSNLSSLMTIFVGAAAAAILLYCDDCRQRTSVRVTETGVARSPREPGGRPATFWTRRNSTPPMFTTRM